MSLKPLAISYLLAQVVEAPREGTRAVKGGRPDHDEPASFPKGTIVRLGLASFFVFFVTGLTRTSTNLLIDPRGSRRRVGLFSTHGA